MGRSAHWGKKQKQADTKTDHIRAAIEVLTRSSASLVNPLLQVRVSSRQMSGKKDLIDFS